MDETRLTADLPTLNVEIIHRAAPDGHGEMVAIQLNATPDFRSALPLLAGMAQLPLMLGQSAAGPDAAAALAAPFPLPFALWTRAAQAMMAPWLALARINPLLAGNPFLAPADDQNQGTVKK